MKKIKRITNGYLIHITRDIRFWFWILCMAAFLALTLVRIGI
ncbi:MAG: hypothetical protein ABI844_03360 [Saprospiraceae bacterium]